MISFIYPVVFSLLLTNQVYGFQNPNDCGVLCDNKFVGESKTACNRGCRFASISRFVSFGRPVSYTEDCENNCGQAYANNNLLESCKFGCRSQNSADPFGSIFGSNGLGSDSKDPVNALTSFRSFFDDLSNAVFSQMISTHDLENVHKQPMGMVRIISSGNSPGLQPRVIFRISQNRNMEPVQPAFVHHEIEPIIKPSEHRSMHSNMKAPEYKKLSRKEWCLAPMYDTLSVTKCRGYFPKWNYNKETGSCDQFIYGGCGDVDNMFDSQAECIQTCSIYSKNRPSPHLRRKFDFWFFVLSLLCFMIAICCILAYYERRKRQMASRAFVNTSQGLLGDESKVFLVAPQMSFNKKIDGMALPPSYDQVLKAAKDQPSCEGKEN